MPANGLETVKVSDAFHHRFVHHNSNSMEISFSCNSVAGDHVATKFRSCHDRTAVVPRAKLCSDRFNKIWMRAKWTFHHIWIVMEIFSEMGLRSSVYTYNTVTRSLQNIVVYGQLYFSWILSSQINSTASCKICSDLLTRWDNFIINPLRPNDAVRCHAS